MFIQDAGCHTSLKKTLFLLMSKLTKLHNSSICSGVGGGDKSCYLFCKIGACLLLLSLEQGVNHWLHI